MVRVRLRARVRASVRVRVRVRVVWARYRWKLVPVERSSMGLLTSLCRRYREI